MPPMYTDACAVSNQVDHLGMALCQLYEALGRAFSETDMPLDGLLCDTQPEAFSVRPEVNCSVGHARS
jgi:hypothetical protein